MIQCDKCKQLFNDGDTLVECVEVEYKPEDGFDRTEYLSMANIWRYCKDCWKRKD